MRIVSFFLSLVAFASAATAWEKPDFPRLGGYKISGSGYENTTYQNQLARLDLAILAMYPGWEQATGYKMQTVVQNIKARNPNAVVLNYANLVESKTVNTPNYYGEAWTKLNTMKWWLYPKTTVGTAVLSGWPGQTATNLTNYVRKDANGDRYNTWYAKWAHGKIAKTAPALDGIFTDVFRWRPKNAGDWNLDGTSDSISDATIGRAYREGFRDYVNTFKGLMPGKYHLGNIGPWQEPGAILTEYKGLLHGGVLEHYIGSSWSLEGLDANGNLNKFGSWKLMMDRYHLAMTQVSEPKLIILGQYGDPKNYRNMRYGLTSTLMNDGYYDFSPNNEGGMGYKAVVWFDEFDVNLGKSVAPPSTTAWQSGVYRRDFENGIALVNPRGNGARTVDLGEDFRKITGKQDPAVNNGQVVRKVTLQDRDGIILMRLNAVKKPMPPASLSVQ